MPTLSSGVLALCGAAGEAATSVNSKTRAPRQSRLDTELSSFILWPTMSGRGENDTCTPMAKTTARDSVGAIRSTKILWGKKTLMTATDVTAARHRKDSPGACATPGPRSFNCTCSGPGTPTHWMGQVRGSSYSSAQQTASGACVAYNQGKPPPYGSAGGIGAGNSFGPLPGAAQNVGAANFFPFPGVAQSSGASNSLGGLPGTTQGPGQANSFGAPPSVLSFSSAQQQRLCSQCVCN